MRSGLVVIAGALVFAVALRAEDATTPVDYSRRNTPFTPSGTVKPPQKSPQVDPVVQEKRVDINTVDKKTSPIGDKRAAIDLQETHEKTIHEKDSRRPEKIDEPVSALNHRVAPISTADDTKKPPIVSKYQDSLSAASSTNMARFPALDHATSAKINRFVFKKNPPDPSTSSPAAQSTPAAGGSPVLK